MIRVKVSAKALILDTQHAIYVIYQWGNFLFQKYLYKSHWILKIFYKTFYFSVIFKSTVEEISKEAALYETESVRVLLLILSWTHFMPM